jgi:hypothetical protein
MACQKDSFRLTRNGMRKLTQCACGASQNPQPKLIVFETESKTNFETDERYNRLPSRIHIKKAKIAYVSTQGSGTNKDFVSVFLTNGKEYFSTHKLSSFLHILPNAVQPNKSNIVSVNKICASNEWFYIYAMCGGKEVDFEVMPLYRDVLKRQVTEITTLPKNHEKRLPD